MNLQTHFGFRGNDPKPRLNSYITSSKLAFDADEQTWTPHPEALTVRDGHSQGLSQTQQTVSICWAYLTCTGQVRPADAHCLLCL